MCHLALLAVLLLACVPVLGRLANAMPAQALQMRDAITALCTGEGLRQLALPVADAAAAHPHHHQPAPTPHHPAGQAQDCDYCPLLASLVALAVITLAAWTPASTLPAARVAAAPRGSFQHPTGLGSRGPPAFA